MVYGPGARKRAWFSILNQGVLMAPLSNNQSSYIITSHVSYVFLFKQEIKIDEKNTLVQVSFHLNKELSLLNMTSTGVIGIVGESLYPIVKGSVKPIL